MDIKITSTMINIAKNNRLLATLCFLTIRTSSLVFAVIYFATAFVLAYTDGPKLSFFIAVPFICLLTTYAMRLIVKKQRPYKKMKFDLMFNLRKKESYSFPSNHSTCSFIIAFGCGFVNPYLGLVVGLLAIITGLSRVFLGLHYISDVSAGWLLSFIFGVIGFVLLPYM